MARQQFRKHNTTTNKEQMARQQMMTQSNVGFSVHVSRCDPLMSPDFSSTFLGATLDATRFLFPVSRCHPLTSLGTISAHTSSQMLQMYMFKLCVLFVVVCICCACFMRRILVSICCCRWCMSFVVLLLSFLVVICRLWLRFAFVCLRHFRLSTLFAFVCTCVRMCVAGGFQSH